MASDDTVRLCPVCEGDSQRDSRIVVLSRFIYGLPALLMLLGVYFYSRIPAGSISTAQTHTLFMGLFGAGGVILLGAAAQEMIYRFRQRCAACGHLRGRVVNGVPHE